MVSNCWVWFEVKEGTAGSSDVLFLPGVCLCKEQRRAWDGLIQP